MSQNSRTTIQLVSVLDITFTEVFEQFQVFSKAKNLSPETLRFYEQTKRAIFKYMGNDFPIAQFDQQKLYEFINYLRDEVGNKDATINTHMRSLRAIFNFATEHEYMKPIVVKSIKAESPIMPTYTEAEMILLLKKPDMKKANFAEYRNWVIVSFLIGTGARASTVCNIKIKDLDIDLSEVIFRHMKTRKQIVVPISTTLKGIIMQYLKVRKGENNDYLFCEQHGEMLSPNALKFAIKRYNIRRGVMSTSIHQFRHTFAKMFILAGGNAFVLQRLLGHSDITMTMRYVHLFGNDLSHNYDKFNPLSNLLKSKDHIKIRK